MCEGCYAKTLPPEEREKWIKNFIFMWKNIPQSDYQKIEALFTTATKKLSVLTLTSHHMPLNQPEYP